MKAYFEAQKLKQKEQIAMMNISAWYQGIYNQYSIGSCFNEKCQYPNKPLDLTAKKEIPTTADTTVNANAVRFSAWSKSFNQNFIKQHPENQ